MFNKKKNNKGFTLVELLVVIAIIGILAVVALPALFKNIDKAKVADLEADISAIKSATISYTTDINKLPKDASTKSEIITNLNGELDSLSDPFKATTYVLTATGGNSPTGEVTLTINFGSPLSTNAESKLEEDLSSMLPSDATGEGIVNAARTQLKVKLVEAGGLTQSTKVGQ